MAQPQQPMAGGDIYKAPMAAPATDNAAIPLVQAAPYQIVNNRPVVMGAYGFPRAQPKFPPWKFALNGLRGYPNIMLPCDSCNCYPGPDIPAHWWDADDGWVTAYFTNEVAYDRDWCQEKEKGVFVCKVPRPDGQPCNHRYENDACCEGNFCMCVGSYATKHMAAHLQTQHGFRPPPKREWATGLFETEGCGDVLCCTPCHGSRQMMAMLGHKDTFNVWWCLYFFCAGLQRASNAGGQGGQGGGGGGGGGDKDGVVYIPPWTLAAILTRPQIRALNNIDEGCCKTCLIAWCCSCCSLAQSYREVSSAGVWPGGTACASAPPMAMMKPAQLQA